MKLIRTAHACLNSTGPAYFIIYVTGRCNARCEMCYYWQEIDGADKRRELSLAEFDAISRQLPSFIQLSIGGGEPTLREDLAEICQLFCRQNHVQFITLPTNGINTIQVLQQVEAILQKCPQTHLRVSLSLDGFQSVHEKIRGVPGAYLKTVTTYSELLKLKGRYKNFSVDLATVLQTANRHIALDFFRFVKQELNPDNHMLLLARGKPRVEAAQLDDLDLYKQIASWLRHAYHKKEQRVFSSLLRAVTARSLELIFRERSQNQFQIPCVAGKKLLVISEYGDVKPCEILSHTYGNLRDHNYNLSSILNLPNVQAQIRWIRQSRCHCSFECASNISVICHWRGYPQLLKTTLQNLWQRESECQK